MDYGLIGAKLGHSYSKDIHESLGEYTYQLHPLPTEEEAHAFLREHPFKAINVTIPYKKLVIPYCCQVSPQAQAIGAVNCVVNREGKLYGYNTDYSGFCWLLDHNGIDVTGKTVLILGSGATRNTTTAVCRDRNAREILVAGRKGGEGILTYEEAAAHAEVNIIINASPAGMYPDTGVCLLDITGMPALEAVVDCVYNPFATELMLRAREQGVKAVCGIEMLVAQAVYAAELFLDKKLDCDAVIQQVAHRMKAQMSNVSLIGMPSAGKTGVGKWLARQLGKTFVDLDEEIEKAAGKPIPEIFAAEGESGFRAWETRITAQFSKEKGQVLSCGGGIVTRPENPRLLHQNGIVIYIDRPVSQLAVGGHRPLSKSPEALAEMERVRRPLYEAAADAVVVNDCDWSTLCNRVLAAATACFSDSI